MDKSIVLGSGGRATQQSFIEAGSDPRSNPLAFYILFLTEMVLLLLTKSCPVHIRWNLDLTNLCITKASV